MSCAHLTDEEREKEMRKAQSYGVKVVLGTIGEDGSYVLYNDKILYAPAVHADDVIDTMGAEILISQHFYVRFLKRQRKERSLREQMKKWQKDFRRQWEKARYLRRKYVL